MAVEPAAPGRGPRTVAGAACEERALSVVAPKLMLMVRSINEAVLAFYGQLGYEMNDVATLGRFLDR